MSSSKRETLPLGAVRTAEGDVVVPASRRADGSTRKPIRIRQGYVPQDEVPKYKTVAQRRREQEAKRAEQASGSAAKRTDSDAVDELPLEQLSLRQEPTPRAAAPRERQRERPERGEEKQGTAEDSKRRQHLKRQLTKLNKLLKDVGKLEAVADSEALTAAQQQKLARKPALQQERQAIIAELNGATVTSSTSASGRTKVAISL